MEFLLLVVLLLVAMTWAWTLYLVWSLSVSEDQDPLSVPASEAQLVESRQFHEGETAHQAFLKRDEQSRKGFYETLVKGGTLLKGKA